MIFFDALSELQGLLPSGQNAGSIGSSAFHVLTIGILVIIALAVVGIGVFYILRFLKFKYKIEIYEKVGNSIEKTGKDRAMELRYNIAGDSVFRLMKRKKFLPRPEIQTGRRNYIFFIREDGEWINVGIEDIDLKMKKLNVRFLHPEMRYARTAIERNLKERFDKPKFFEKYGAMIFNIAAIAIIMVFLWLIVDKILGAQEAATASVKVAGEVMDKVKQVVASLDSICTGSGYTPS